MTSNSQLNFESSKIALGDIGKTSGKAPKGNKKLFVKSFGCQMNFYDSHRMADVMSSHGYASADVYKDADLVILNTCHIREKAAEKVYSELGRINREKLRMAEQGKEMKIVVSGCVAQAEGEEIFKRANYVNAVVGPQSYQDLPEILAKGEKKATKLDFFSEDKFDKLPQETAPQGVSAFISIQEGCDKFCTYCVVPYTRGAEFSRKVEDVMQEVRFVVEQGSKEIYLLGQNVNAYHGQDAAGNTWSLAKLCEEVGNLQGVERVRYTTSHPSDMSDDLIWAHGNIPKLMPFLHLPVQSGSNKVLSEMNRKHTAQSYLETINRLKKINPDMAFSSDFIVGFPGETEQDFTDTLNLIKEVGYSHCYSFKYSPRPGTPGAEREDQLDEKVKDERLKELQALLCEQQQSFNESKVGTIQPVMFESLGKKEGQVMGKTPYMQSCIVEFDKGNLNSLHGKILNVKITSAGLNSIKGELME